MSGLDDLAKQAGDFVEQHKDQIQEALKSEQAEDISDKILEGASDAANKVTGGKHAATVDSVRENIDKAVGNQ